jgi:hypothetical protein
MEKFVQKVAPIVLRRRSERLEILAFRHPLAHVRRRMQAEGPL